MECSSHSFSPPSEIFKGTLLAIFVLSLCLTVLSGFFRRIWDMPTDAERLFASAASLVLISALVVFGWRIYLVLPTVVTSCRAWSANLTERGDGEYICTIHVTYRLENDTLVSGEIEKGISARAWTWVSLCPTPLIINVGASLTLLSRAPVSSPISHSISHPS
jgi:hypothetical protein